MNKFIILLLFPLSLFGQVNVPVIKVHSGKDTIYVDDLSSIKTFRQGTVYAERDYDTLFYSDTLNFVLNKWIDKSGNNNHLDLIQSNCYSDSVSNRNIPLPPTFQKLDTFYISWEGYLYNTSQDGAFFLHHYNTGNRLYLKTNATDFTITLGGSSTENVSGIKYYLNTHYRISVYCRGTDGSGNCTITVKFDGHDEQSYTKAYTGLVFQGVNTYLFGGTSPCQRGKVWNLNIDGRLYPLAEGGGFKIFDASGEGKHLTVAVNYLWAKQNFYHYNLHYGFQLYQYPGKSDIRVPYSVNSDTAIFKGVVNATDAYVFCGLFPALKNSHNRAETQLRQNNSIFDSNGFWTSNKTSTDFVSNYYDYIFADISDSVYLTNILSTSRKLSGADKLAIENSTNKQTLDIYLLIGQSNAAGQAILSDSVNINIWKIRYGKYIATKTKVEPINPTAYNCYYPRTVHVYYGLENSFLNTIDSEENHIPTIIKYAVGGTKLYNYAPSWYPEIAGQYFDRFVWHTDSILSYISGKFNYELKGIIWFQGESDGAVEDYANAYQQNEVYFINTIRSHYGNLPFYSCKINEPNVNYPFCEVVNDAKEYNDTNVDDYYLISTDDLNWQEGITHMTTKGYIELGKRIANLINSQ